MIVFAFLAAILSALANFYPKTYIPRFDPLVLAFLKNAYVGVILLLFFVKRSRREEIKELKKKDYFLLGAISLIGGSIPYSLFFLGAQSTGAYMSNLIHKTLFIWVVVFAFFFLKERLNWLEFIGFVLIVIGSFYVIPIRANLSFNRGELLIFVAVILWAVDFILLKKALTTMSMFVVGLAKFGVGSILFYLFIIFLNKTKLIIPLDLDAFFIVAGHGTFLFFYIYCLYMTLFFLPASATSLILTLSVVMSLMTDLIYFHVKPSINVIYSSALIAIATGSILFGQNKHIKKAGLTPPF